MMDYGRKVSSSIDWDWAGAGFEDYNQLVKIQNTKSQSWHGLLDKAAVLG